MTYLAPSDQIPTESVDGFITLFRGRGDVYGHDEGRCVKGALNRERFLGHLHGDELIGVYPMVPHGNEHVVVWGCSDFDNGEVSFDDAQKLRHALLAVGITSWIERSRSKGHHLWVFAEAPVPAIVMRHMLLAAHQVANVPAKEVNPKQETLAPGQYGNYVRLPYGNVRDVYCRRQRILASTSHHDGQYSDILFNDFVRDAMASRTPVALIHSVAQMYVPPVIVAIPITDTPYSATLDEAMRLLKPLAKVIWRDGPLAGNDRSSTLARLGFECAETGLNPSQTKIVLQTADKRWGKYHLRPNGETEIDKLVIRVHSK
jgi:hypothetical protein